MSFIGIAINIWRDTSGTGGTPVPGGALQQRDLAYIFQRDGAFIRNVAQG